MAIGIRDHSANRRPFTKYQTHMPQYPAMHPAIAINQIAKYRVAAKSKLERANVDAHQQDAAHAAKLFQPAEKRVWAALPFPGSQA